jgi:hypothetical protein
VRGIRVTIRLLAANSKTFQNEDPCVGAYAGNADPENWALSPYFIRPSVMALTQFPSVLDNLAKNPSFGRAAESH